MLTNLLRLALTLSGAYSGHANPAEARHEAAHVLCEQSLYAALAPSVADDATDPLAEWAAEALCRYEVAGEPWDR